MGFSAGLLVAIFSLTAAVVHLHHEARTLWDFVAFVCVTGGTIAVGLMIFPWKYRHVISRSFFSLFYTPARHDSELISECLNFLRNIQSQQYGYQTSAESLAGEVLRDGAELLGLGFTRDRIHEILAERIHQSFERSTKVSNSVRSLAKYPPAFGLAGTVLGLVSLMRQVSEGADAKQTGLMMAVALMATFYGLLMANLIVNPAGEHMHKNALEERKRAEIALHAVLLAADRTGLLESQEVLNSYVARDQRVNVMSGIAEAS